MSPLQVGIPLQVHVFLEVTYIQGGVAWEEANYLAGSVEITTNNYAKQPNLSSKNFHLLWIIRTCKCNMFVIFRSYWYK